MFTSLIAACRRAFAFVSFIVLGVLRLARWLLSALVGSWQPPLWLRKLWQGLCACGRWLRARPGKTAAGLAVLAGCGGGGDSPDPVAGGPANAREFRGTVTEVLGPDTFAVEGIPVNASASSVPSNLAVGTEVTVSGVMTNGVIQATRIEFRGIEGIRPSVRGFLGCLGDVRRHRHAGRQIPKLERDTQVALPPDACVIVGG